LYTFGRGPQQNICINANALEGSAYNVCGLMSVCCVG
jgi:hypothetical protein